MRRSQTLAEQVGALRRTLHRAISGRLARETDHSFVELLALRVVAAGEVSTQGALAERLMIDPPAASRLVTRLEQDGLVTRTAGADRRCAVLSLTNDGRRELQALEETLRWVDAKVRRELPSAEYDALLERMEALTRALAEQPEGAQ